MSLNKILESFSKGEIDKETAKELIHSFYGKSKSAPATETQGKPTAGPLPEERGDRTESLKRALASFRKSKNLDGLLKASTDIMHQLAENVPSQLERLRENVPSQLERLRENVLHDISVAGVASNVKGITSKLSIFRSFSVSEDSAVEENMAIGSQWFAVKFDRHADVRQNKFTAVQFSEVAAVQSNLCSNLISLSRWSNVSLQECKVEENRFSRMTFSDVSIAESDFTENKVQKSEFAQTVVNASRLAGNQFSGVMFRECEFDECDIQGVEFENCHFEECSFTRVEVNAGKPVRIANRNLTGRAFANIHSAEELLAAFETQAHDTVPPARPAEPEEREAPVAEPAAKDAIAADHHADDAHERPKEGAPRRHRGPRGGQSGSFRSQPQRGPAREKPSSGEPRKRR